LVVELGMESIMHPAIQVVERDGIEIYTMKSGTFAFGLMLHTKRTNKVIFNFIEDNGAITTIPCTWNPLHERYCEDVAIVDDKDTV
jgi:hypothetical protein